MKKAIIYGLIAAVLIGALGRGHLSFTLISMSALLYLGVPSVVVIVLGALMKRLAPKRAILFKTAQHYAAIIFVLLVFQSLGILIGHQLHHIDLEEAKQLCEKLGDQLPEQRNEFFKKSDIRWRKHMNYGTDGGIFFCALSDPGTIFTIWFYQNGQWVSD